MNGECTASPQTQLLSARSEARRASALARFEQLRPALEDNVPLARLARELRVPRRTMQRWVSRYRRQGLSGLVRGQRSDHGHHRLRPGLREAIEGLALQRPPRSPASIQRQVAAIARVVRKRAKQAGLAPVGAQDLRRTAIYNLIEAGVSLADVNRQFGFVSHLTLATRYDHRDLTDLSLGPKSRQPARKSLPFGCS